MTKVLGLESSLDEWTAHFSTRKIYFADVFKIPKYQKRMTNLKIDSSVEHYAKQRLSGVDLDESRRQIQEFNMLKNNDIRQRISNKCLLGHKTHLGFLTGCTVFHPHFGKGKVLGYSEEGDLVTLRMEGNKEIGMPPEELLEPGFEWSDERNLLTRTISHLSSLSRW